MSLEFGHFQPELWLSSCFICPLLQWPLNGYLSYIYCPCCYRGYCMKKCIWSCHFLLYKLLLVPFPLRCSLFGLNTSLGPLSAFQHAYLTLQPQWEVYRCPNMHGCVFVDVCIFHLFVGKLLLWFQLHIPKEALFMYANISSLVHPGETSFFPRPYPILYQIYKNASKSYIYNNMFAQRTLWRFVEGTSQLFGSSSLI